MEFGFDKMESLRSLFVLFFLSLVLAQESVTLFEYSVTENAPDGTFVGDVGTDAKRSGELDASVSSVFTFQILSQGNPNAEYFTIEEDTGVLRTSKQIVRDSICPNLDTCLLDLRVAVTGAAEFYVMFRITVDIIDFNNNAPEWAEGTIERSIPENTPVGSSFSIPTAQDPDSKKYSIKRYELFEAVPQFDLKVRNISGSIDLYLVLRVAVDREVTDSYTVKVIAYDGGVPPKSGTLTVNIMIQDNNDNRPTFEKDLYEVNIFENAAIDSSVVQVKATDPDAGANGKVLYALAQRTQENFGDMFQIDSDSGLITLRRELDYETKTTYNLFVSAQEQNPEFLPQEVRVIVNVADVNDHAPRITVNSLTESGVAEVSETAPPGSFLAHIIVDDPDTGYNGQFSCDLENPQEKFSLDQKYDNEFTLKTAARFDRELEEDYEVVFVCADKGTDPMTGTSTITIMILDENDNYPAFSDNLFSTEVDENNPVGMFLMQFRASDLDSGVNGEIEYTIHNSAQDFVAYDPVSGNLTAKDSFDFERFQSITFQITAQDKGTPPKSSSATILIKIRDLNDEAPEFLMPKYVFGVYEEQKVGHLVGEVSAIDRDNEPNNEFIYSLKPAVDARDTFVIEPLSGKILTQRKLDRETEDSFNMVVIATDKHDPLLSSTVSVSVYVVDTNDHAPQIDFPNADNNTVYISNRPTGQQLPRILAHDKDIEQNGKLQFELDTTDDTFIVDENTGQLYIQKDIQMLNDRESFVLDVIVRDSGDVPLLARGTLVVIVNATGSESSASLSSIINGNNLVIVIIVAIVSGVITLALVAAIIYLKRQDIILRKKRPPMPAAIVMETGSGDGGDSGAKKEVSFSQEVMKQTTSSYDPVDWKASANPDDKTYHQKTKPGQTKADKQWKVQHYLSHIPPVDHDTDSIHSTGADSGMGSNEEQHQPPSPDKHGTQVSDSTHPPIPPRAPIVRPSAPQSYPHDPPRSVTPSPYYNSSGNVHRPPHPGVKAQRSNSLQGRDNAAYYHNDHNVPRSSGGHNGPRGSSRSRNSRRDFHKGDANVTHVQLEDRVTIRHASVV